MPFFDLSAGRGHKAVPLSSVKSVEIVSQCHGNRMVYDVVTTFENGKGILERYVGPNLLEHAPASRPVRVTVAPQT